MLQKNIDKENRKKRAKQWTGLFTRKTPTKKEKQDKINKKYINRYAVDKHLVDKY